MPARWTNSLDITRRRRIPCGSIGCSVQILNHFTPLVQASINIAVRCQVIIAIFFNDWIVGLILCSADHCTYIQIFFEPALGSDQKSMVILTTIINTITTSKRRIHRKRVVFAGYRIIDQDVLNISTNISSILKLISQVKDKSRWRLNWFEQGWAVAG